MAQELSKYFTWGEVVASETAKRFKLDNSVPMSLVPAVTATARCMDTVRELLGNPIKVTSWYRSPEVNWNVGSSKTSHHLKGVAVDFVCPQFGTPYEICSFLQQHMAALGIDQLIYEISWVHISFNRPARNQALTFKQGSYLKGIQK